MTTAPDSERSVSRGRVITFYSYKGGTGRTMALANCACLLADGKVGLDGNDRVPRRVLMVDWDLEAPGLDLYFAPKDVSATERAHFDARPGMIEFFSALNASLTENDAASSDYDERASGRRALDAIDLNDYIVGLETESTDGLEGGTLDLIKAGKRDDEMADRVAAFDWPAMFDRSPSIFGMWAEDLASRYDFVLIDARTGLVDTSGICTMLMPDTLVAVFTPNTQSLDGLSQLIRRAVDYRRESDDLRALSVFPLPSRVEPSLPDLYRAWRLGGEPSPLKVGDGYQPRFEGVLAEVYGLDSLHAADVGDENGGGEGGGMGEEVGSNCDLKEYFDAVELQHVPDYAYGEPIPVRTEELDSRLSLRRSYQEFATRLVYLEGPWQTVDEAKAIRTVVAAIKSVEEILGADGPRRTDDAIRELDVALVASRHAAPNINAQLALAHREVVDAKLADGDHLGAIALARRALTLGADNTPEGAPERTALTLSLAGALEKFASALETDRPVQALEATVERLKLIEDFNAFITDSSRLATPDEMLVAYNKLGDYADRVRTVLKGKDDGIAGDLLRTAETLARSAVHHDVAVTAGAGAQVAAGSNIVQVIVNQLPAAKRQKAEAALNEYLSTLWARLINLPLLAITRRGSGDEDVPLTAVYTPPDVTARINWDLVDVDRDVLGTDSATLENMNFHGASDLRKADVGVLRHILDRHHLRATRRTSGTKFSRSTPSEILRPAPDDAISALEVLATYPRLVLLGAPGSGKSTFARFVTLCMAGELLGRSRANLRVLNGERPAEVEEDPIWPHGVLVPLFVELRHFVASNSFPESNIKGDSKHLLEFVRSTSADALPLAMHELLIEVLATGKTILILDGLDEVDDSDQRRERLRAVIAGFAEAYPKCRILVTARPYAYEPDSPWRLDSSDFASTTLSPFDDEQIGEFISRWYQRLIDRHQLDAATAERQERSLKNAVANYTYLKPLVEQPLLLTMIADVHAASGGSLPAARSDVYERSVELLLDRWNQNRGLVDENDLAADLGLTLADIRLALETLAEQVHGRAPDTAQAADIARSDLWAALNEQRKSKGIDRADESRIMDYLQRRSGILVAESSDVYRFPHRSYQEYLAACTLVRDPGFPDDAIARAKADLPRWREVIRYVAGKSTQTPVTYWALVEGLAPGDPSDVDRTRPDDSAAALAYLAALSIDELDTWQSVPKMHAPKLERVRQWLNDIVVEGRLSPADRADAGRILSLLGDDRPGVGLHPDNVPWIDWVTIPAGPFIMGSDKAHDRDASDNEETRESAEIDAFRIARYPVTIAQYRAFVDAKGYDADELWTDAGRKFRKDNSREAPDHWEIQKEWGDNSPVTGVTFFEAVAYCRWLTVRLRECGELTVDQDIWLPTEAQWEKAARGIDGRAYPWGNAFDELRANTSEAGIGRPTVVGMFPLGGDDPWKEGGGGPLDMSGNVWEWCVTEWHDKRDHSDYEQRLGEEGATYLEGSAARVVRGGSFGGARLRARCASRSGHYPGSGWHPQGFRVAAPVQLGSSEL